MPTHTSRGGAELQQTPGRPRSPTWGSIPPPRDHDMPKSRTPNQLNRPGAPEERLTNARDPPCLPSSQARLRAAPYLCGVGDGGQLQVLRVPPSEEAALGRHGQAAVTVGGHLHDVHSGQVPAQLGGHAGDVVVTQTCRNGEALLPVTDSWHRRFQGLPTCRAQF